MTGRVIQTADPVSGGASAQVEASSRAPSFGRLQANPKDILFDPQKRAASPGLKASTTRLAGFLEAQERELELRARKRSRPQVKAFRLALEALACNLAWLLMAAPGHSMAVPRDNNLLRAKNRYKPEVYGQGFLEVLDRMARPEVGLIEKIQRGFKVGKNRQASLVRPLPAFELHVPVTGLTWESFTRLPPREVLVLKSAKDTEGNSHGIAYQDTDRLRKMRNEMVRLNKALQSMPIFLRVAPGAALVDHDGLPVDPTKRALRRIFNNASWQEGGRLFDGFWETMPRAMRFEHLLIGSKDHPEGERIANVDFEQLFPRLAYFRANIDPPEGDLYDIEGDGSNRKVWKQLLNAQLFAKSPLKTWPRGAHEAFERPIPFKQACAIMAERHRPIAPQFGTGVGFRFMFQESSALVTALGYLKHEGIHALPLHDSVLVPRSSAERARELLQAGLERSTGIPRAALSIDYGVDINKQ